jgi:hypothetical protein
MEAEALKILQLASNTATSTSLTVGLICVQGLFAHIQTPNW